MTDYRYKSVYTGGKFFIVSSTMGPEEFVRIEKKSAGKNLATIYRSTLDFSGNDTWKQIYPPLNPYNYP